MTSIRDLEDLRKIRRAWAEITSGGSTLPVTIDDGQLHVFCSRESEARQIEERSDDLAASLNSKVRIRNMLTRVVAHEVDLSALILARRLADLEDLLIDHA